MIQRSEPEDKRTDIKTVLHVTALQIGSPGTLPTHRTERDRINYYSRGCHRGGYSCIFRLREDILGIFGSSPRERGTSVVAREVVDLGFEKD